MTTTLTPPGATGTGKKHPARQRALQPYLDKLKAWTEQVGASDPDRPARINVGTRTITLEPWERTTLESFFDAPPDSSDEPTTILAHSAALVLKTTFDVERLKKDEQHNAANLYALQAELMLDTALGMAVLDESQKAIDVLVKAGRFEHAKAFSKFRHQVKHAIGEAKKRIAESELRQAEALSNSLGDRIPQKEPERIEASPTSAPQVSVEAEGEGGADVVIGEVAPPPRSRRKKRRSRRPGALPGPVQTGGLPSLTNVLSVALAVSLAAWLTIVIVPRMFGTDVPRLLRSDLSNAEQFESLEARPPSIYATIGTERWARADDQDRRRLIDDLGQRAGKMGYSGVLLTTTDGEPVARWLRTRGYELILHHEELPFQAVGY